MLKILLAGDWINEHSWRLMLGEELRCSPEARRHVLRECWVGHDRHKWNKYRLLCELHLVMLRLLAVGVGHSV